MPSLRDAAFGGCVRGNGRLVTPTGKTDEKHDSINRAVDAVVAFLAQLVVPALAGIRRPSAIFYTETSRVPQSSRRFPPEFPQIVCRRIFAQGRGGIYSRLRLVG